MTGGSYFEVRVSVSKRNTFPILEHSTLIANLPDRVRSSTATLYNKYNAALAELSQLWGLRNGKWFIFSEAISKVGTTFSASAGRPARSPPGP